MFGPSVILHKSEAELETMGKNHGERKIPDGGTGINNTNENLDVQW